MRSVIRLAATILSSHIPSFHSSIAWYRLEPEGRWLLVLGCRCGTVEGIGLSLSTCLSMKFKLQLCKHSVHGPIAATISHFLFWYILQDEAYNNIESILWKTTYIVDSRAAHLISECDSTSNCSNEFHDPVDVALISVPRSDGDGCDRDQLQTSKELTEIFSFWIKNGRWDQGSREAKQIY